MNTRLSAVWIAVALVVSLAGCGRTGELSDSKSAADTAPAKADVPPPQAQAVTIAEGTPIKVRTDTTLSTKDTKTGDTFKATLSEPIVVEGKEIAPRGSQVEGRVVNSDSGGRVKGVATISVRLTKIHVASREVAINTGVIARKAHATKRKDAAKVGIGAGIGAAIGAIAGGGQGAAIGAASGGAAGTGLVLATHGEPAVLPAESGLTFKLTSAVTVEPS